MNLDNLLTMLGVGEFVFGMIIVPLVVFVLKIVRGMKCQLRNDMLQIYREHKMVKKITQYEFENFVYLYQAYKKLGGNSFIDKIYKEITTEWEIIL